MEFTNFIRSFFIRANLLESNILLFTGKKEMEMFLEAFTDASYDEIYNYELIEFSGDLDVNRAIGGYIRQRYPHIINVEWLTKIKHYLTSKRALSIIADKLGFVEYIRYGSVMNEE